MTKKQTIALGADHGGFDLKQNLAGHLRAAGHTVTDVGTNDTQSVDYPKFAEAVARLVASGQARFGIMIDGAGIGSAMAANKIAGVLAAACTSEVLARNSREHNGANVLTLGAGQVSLGQAKAIADVFLSTECTEERHQRRVGMILGLEGGGGAAGAGANASDLSRFTCMNSGGGSAGSGSPGGVNLDGIDPADVDLIVARAQQMLAGSGAGPGAFAPATIGPEAMAQMIDHTVLKPEASLADVEKLCAEAREHNFISVCVNPSYAREAKELLKGTSVKVCCVVGFPLGAQPGESKAMDARRCIREGAKEIDMVVNVGAVKSGDWDLVLKDIRAVVEACRDGSAMSKVILETSLLTDEEKVKVCEISMRAGADFVKTSTGFGSGGATAEDISLMARTVAPKKLGVKASGGVRTYQDAVKMIQAGATRVGASSSVKIIEQAREAAPKG